MDLPPVPYFVTLLVIEGFSAEAQQRARGNTHVATGEVTALKHELRDDTVEFGAIISKALLASAESTEVLSCLGDVFVEELEVDATLLVCRAGERQQWLVRIGGGAKMSMIMAPR
jgi:hypothetical protein